jgi:molybdopterin/thiamine biosynthesis adenylyltransferase
MRKSMLHTEIITRPQILSDTAIEEGKHWASLCGSRILVVGAGNIGAPTIRLLAQTGVALIRIVDRDGVESANLATQGYLASEVGQHKAHVLGRRIQQNHPFVKVESYASDLEDLPLGLFGDVDLVIGALDSRRARQALATEIAWPLRLTVLDGAVGVGAGLVGRVQVLKPESDSACLECSFSQDDYRLLAAEYPCNTDYMTTVPPSGSPAFLGAAVASTLVTEAARLLSGESPTGSHEIVFDLWSSRILRSRLRHSASCRFDHVIVGQVIRLDRPFAAATAGDLLGALEREYQAQLVHLECRRGLRLATPASRIIDRATLAVLHDELLVDFGLTPLDRLRVRSERGPDAFIVFDSPAIPVEKAP